MLKILEDTVRTYSWLYKVTGNEAYRVAWVNASKRLYEAVRASQDLKEVA